MYAARYGAPRNMKNIVILGSTGSIGKQALDVVKMQGYKVIALTAQKNEAELEKQIREYKPMYAAMADEKAAESLKIKVADTNTKVLLGKEGVCECASLRCDYVLNSIVGMAGLEPTLKAIEAGNDIALANKETLVEGGALVTQKAAEKNVRILPVDKIGYLY